ncbi:MAG: phosphatidate cytidylyltransferase [Bacillota bacterium]|nr:phosphatidate cytidylyltransferase [Bacillota bacterium]
MLYLRLLSALIGIPIIIGAVYLGGPWYAVLLLIVANLGMFEYSSMLRARGYRIPLTIGFLGVSLMLTVIYIEQTNFFFPLIMLIFLILFVNALFSMNRSSIAESAVSFWGIIYLGGFCGYMLMLRMVPDGALFTYILLLGVWIHDTAAYFIGKKWGMRKFAPLISPNKSVEGSIAGILTTVVIFFSAVILIPEVMPVNPGQSIVLGLGISVFAQVGDLLESALKRQLEVKDSGSIIPGHGGILDRFDSLLLTAPFVYYFFILIRIL